MRKEQPWGCWQVRLFLLDCRKGIKRPVNLRIYFGPSLADCVSEADPPGPSSPGCSSRRQGRIKTRGRQAAPPLGGYVITLARGARDHKATRGRARHGLQKAPREREGISGWVGHPRAPWFPTAGTRNPDGTHLCHALPPEAETLGGRHGGCLAHLAVSFGAGWRSYKTVSMC